MQRSYLIALIIALTAAVWLLSPYAQDYLRAATGPEVSPTEDVSVPQSDPRDKPLRVRVRHSVAEPRVKSLMLTGQTEPSRSATLKAETAGRVVAVEAVEGAAVQQGDIVVRLAMNDRQARLDEADALLEQRRIEYEAARKLTSKGFETQTKLAEARSLLEAAEAQKQRMELDIAHTAIKAPFDGVLQDRLVEVGDYVGIGDPVAAVVDLDPLLAVAQLSERESAGIRPGSEGRARLITGDVVDGSVRYVSVVGSAGTRTFRVELELANGENRIPAGLTAEVILPVASVDAHRMSPAALTLDDEGVVGVKAVDERDVVLFYPVELVADGADGVWVSGLPREVTIITVGQEFVLPGQAVIPVPEGAPDEAPAPGGES